MSNVLVTGGAGFIGFHLAKKLAEKNHVTIWDNLSRGKMDGGLKQLVESKNVEFEQVDLTKAGEPEKHDAEFGQVYEKPEAVLRTNILSTMNMLDWFKDKKGKILFSSSSETYASTVSRFNAKVPTPEDVPLSIEDIFNPRWSYGGSKIAGELLFANYGKRFGFGYTIIRYHNIYGPRMGHEHVIPEFSERLLRKEEPFRIYGGENTRAFCYITDAVEASIKVMESPKTNGEIVHIGNSSEEISIRGLAEKLMKVTGKKRRIGVLDEAEGSVKRRCPDTTKLKKLTGFEAKVSLEKGLKETFDWYEKNFGEKA